MSSIIEGYNYDIFISYRQKDNKHDGWVSRFVENLKGELESTFKEDISVYFDENPHDRLQETHNVDKSLEGKLNSLIFIPILSQTYCDPNSYAWQNEFLVFLRMAEKDRFGKDIKLKSGNVASRILPIRIHDLDPEDVKLFEKETANVIRAIDFVFKTSTGVNRPLTANEDHPGDNLNKTFFRDQLNKVAIAIKDIIQGLKAQSLPVHSESGQPKLIINKVIFREQKEKTLLPGLFKLNYIQLIFIAAVLIIALIWILPNIFNNGNTRFAKDENGKISVAVTVFTNNTNDTTLSWLANGIPELFRNQLAGSDVLSVQNSQTMYELFESMEQTKSFSVLPKFSRDAAIKLKALTYLTGSFQKSGNNILLLAKLVDTKTDEVVWSKSVEGSSDKPKQLTDSLAAGLRNYLEVKVLKLKNAREYSEMNTDSPEALKKYIEGLNSSMKMDFRSALSFFKEAYNIDTAFTMAAFYAAYECDALSVFQSDPKYRIEENIWLNKAYSGREKLTENYRLWLDMWYEWSVTRNINNVIKDLALLEHSDIKSRIFWDDIAQSYMILDRMGKAVKMYEKIDEIDSDWKEDLKYQHFYVQYGRCCHLFGLHDREAKIFSKGLMFFPDDDDLLWFQTGSAIETADTAKSKEIIKSYVTHLKEAGNAASKIENTLGYLYWYADKCKEAEDHFRLSMKLDTNYDFADFNLASMFLDKQSNIYEAMSIIDKLERKYPVLLKHNNNFNFYKAKGLFIQGKYSTADSVLKSLTDSINWIHVDWDKLKNQVKEALNRQN